MGTISQKFKKTKCCIIVRSALMIPIVNKQKFKKSNEQISVQKTKQQVFLLQQIKIVFIGK